MGDAHQEVDSTTKKSDVRGVANRRSGAEGRHSHLRTREKVPGVRVRSTREFRPPEAGITRPLRTRKISALPPKPADKAGLA